MIPVRVICILSHNQVMASAVAFWVSIPRLRTDEASASGALSKSLASTDVSCMQALSIDSAALHFPRVGSINHVGTPIPRSDGAIGVHTRVWSTACIDGKKFSAHSKFMAGARVTPNFTDI